MVRDPRRQVNLGLARQIGKVLGVIRPATVTSGRRQIGEGD